MNVGGVAAALRSNVVPDEARATVDVRVPTAADAGGRAMRRSAALAPGRSRGRRSRRAAASIVRRWNAAGKVARLYEQAREVARELGQELAEGGTGGGSDGNFTAALGVPTLDGLGAIGDGAHALHEHVDIESLCRACRARRRAHDADNSINIRTS